MPNKRTKLLAYGEAFIEKMQKNDIWFSADVEMVLGAQRHGGFIPWVEKLQFIMTPESFTKMQRLFPNNVISTYYSKEYKSLAPAFVENRDEWKKDQPFVQIKIVVPTTLKKIKKFRNPFWFVLNKVMGRKETTKIAINDLYDVKHEGFFVINSRMASSIKNWIPNITFDMEEMKFNSLTIPVIKEWKSWVINNYGDDYMTAKIPNNIYEYPAPLKKVIEEE